VVDRRILGWEIPASTLQSLPSIFVILFAPAFAWLWSWLGRQGREPGHAVKFTIAIAILAAGFLVLALGIGVTAPGEKVHLGWFVANFLMIVVGELCLAPVGLAMVSQLAPARIVSVMVGAFFLAYSASSFLAGLLAKLTAAPPGAEPVDLAVMAARYGTVFQQLGLAAVVVALVLAVLAPALGRAASARDADGASPAARPPIPA
jgi:POT family proton-dependent oligopeptide transporter